MNRDTNYLKTVFAHQLKYNTKWTKSKTNIIWRNLYVEPKILKMMQMNLFTKQKQTHRLREWIYGNQEEAGGREQDS